MQVGFVLLLLALTAACGSTVRRDGDPSAQGETEDTTGDPVGPGSQSARDVYNEACEVSCARIEACSSEPGDEYAECLEACVSFVTPEGCLDERARALTCPTGCDQPSEECVGNGEASWACHDAMYASSTCDEITCSGAPDDQSCACEAQCGTNVRTASCTANGEDFTCECAVDGVVVTTCTFQQCAPFTGCCFNVLFP